MKKLKNKKLNMNVLKILLILSLILINIVGVKADYSNIYRVKKGDCLEKIADKFSTTKEKLIKINNIKNPNLIFIGQKIKISNNNIYSVKSGDTLVKIAKKFKVKVDNIIKKNNINNPDYIRTGQKLIIPDSKKIENKAYTVMSRSLSNKIIWPCQGKISSSYGWRMHPVYNKRKFHTGIDIALAMGSPIYAVSDGIVIFSNWSSGYGRLIKIKHRDGKVSYYGHNLKLIVEKGDTVKKGKVIALSGNSGVSTGPHLHFEIRINNKHVNPINYLNKNYNEVNNI